MKYYIFLLIITRLFCVTIGYAQDTTKNPPINWHLLDLKTDGYIGISLNKAYQFLKDKKSKTVIIGTIDSGIDTLQKDLAGVLWTNPKEIQGNGIDDDNNGYTDDIHGWNFLSGKNGVMDTTEPNEEVRLYYKLRNQFTGVNTPIKGEEAKFEYWKRVKKAYDMALSEDSMVFELNKIIPTRNITNREILKALNLKPDGVFNSSDLTKLKMNNQDPNYEILRQGKEFWANLFKYFQRLNNRQIIRITDGLINQMLDNFNPDLQSRFRIVGNDPDIFDNIHYGDNQIKNSGDSHGTAVAGFIGAIRNNGYGVDGIADNVRIMAVVGSANGDEYDKDVAVSIRYAVDNGAKIIYLGFGKKFSPHKEWVDEAIKYASKKDVLLIMGAGADKQDNDLNIRYPNDTFLDSTKTDNLIIVGASGSKLDSGLISKQTNYGKKSVDLFAPGVDVTTIDSEAEFTTGECPCFAAAIVTGVAALVLEYYPNLSSKQLKNIILESATPLKGIQVTKPGTKDEKVDFTSLSKTGGIVNAYNAVMIASKMKGERE